MRNLLLVLLSVATLSAHGRTLSWNDMTVAARLDANGRLTVRETLSFVFDGDWNGGERVFRTAGRQRLSVDRMVRIEDGVEVPMVGGDVDAVDHYAMIDNALRWRSRLPSDPPFDNRVIVYAIDYTLDNVLISHGADRFRLNHDFAFPEREGVIRNFALVLDIDPAWSGVQSPHRSNRKDLLPGESAVVTLDLARSASAPPPSSVWMGPAAATRYALLAAFLGVLGLLGFLFYVAERPTGRFEPLEPVESITRDWLDRNVFSDKPEVIGAAWDDDVGAAEVAAVLARLAAAGKIESRVEGKALHLKLLVDRDELEGSDRELIRKLFVRGNETDTDLIRSHYSSKGFDPSKIIKDDIERKLRNIPGWKKKQKRVPWLPDVVLLAAAAGLMVFVAVQGDEVGNGLLIRTAFLSVIFGVLALVAASMQSHAVSRFPRAFTWVALPLLPVVSPVASSIRSVDYGLGALVAAALAALAVMNLVLHVLRIPESKARIAHRKRLASARRYFQEQLRTPQPALDDRWLPYLLAFGLGKNVDRWFRSHGDSHSSAFGHSSTTSGSSSSSTGTSWSGGGGAFGGAGATGSWALAAGAMASGVAAPSSSSSGGGSSSSSSSSGGGGGGGW